MVDTSRSLRRSNPKGSPNPGFPVQGENSESAGKLEERLRICMKLAGGGAALAQKAGIPRSTLETYITGKAEPKVSRVVAIAGAAGVTIDWLASGEGPMERGALSQGELHPTRDPQFKPFVNLDRDLLTDMVVAVEEELAERGLTLAPHRKGELIATLYEMEAEEEQEQHADVTQRNVRRLLRLVS